MLVEFKTKRIVTCACQQRNNLGLFARHDTPVTTHIFPADVLIVCRDDFPQRCLAVLDSTNNGEDAFASTRWNARGVEHLYVVFSNTAVGRVFVRAGYDFMVRAAQASSAAQRSPAAFVAVLAAYTRWRCRRTPLSGALALWLPAERDRPPDLSYLNYQPVATEVVYTNKSHFGKRSLLFICR